MTRCQSLLLNTLLTVPYIFAVKSTPFTINEHARVPNGWTRIRVAPPEEVIELHIGLKQGQFNELEEHLDAVSDPLHSRYRQYLTADEINELIKPSNETLRLVKDWLYAHCITAEQMQYSPASDWIVLHVSVLTAEALLHSQYSEYWHDESKTTVMRAPAWSLPEHLRSHIELVQPTDAFFHSGSSKVTRSLKTEVEGRDDPSELKGLNELAESFSDDLSQSLNLDKLPADLTTDQACNASAVTPLCIRTLYGTLNYTAGAADKNTMALVNFNEQFNNRSDINVFLEAYRPEAAMAGAAHSFRMDNIAGAVNQQSPVTGSQIKEKLGREGNLDAQILLSIAFPTPLIAYSTRGQSPAFKPDRYTPTNTNEPFLTWLQYLLAQQDLPNVIAISYGDIEQTVPYAYAHRVCKAFAQLGARGVSVIFGAGDSGVGKPGYCRSNDGTHAYEFLTSFPAACPYGTSVGATRDIDPVEVVAYNDRNGFVSGGGFSKYFPRPAYQDEAVSAYLDRLGRDKYNGFYNPSGRAYPDVAAQGYRRAMVWNGERYLVDGTSASAPTFGAIVALVNDALIAEGKPPMGFLNPWLYTIGHEAFKDVTNGSNRGCNTSGFPAAEGWDSASGFGTPWFPKFKELALRAPFRSQRPWYWPQ